MIIKKFKKYSMSYRELKVMKKKMLDSSTLYRTIFSDSYQTKYSKSDENSNQNYSTKNLVSDKNDENKTISLSQNEGESTMNFKPEFKL